MNAAQATPTASASGVRARRGTVGVGVVTGALFREGEGLYHRLGGSACPGNVVGTRVARNPGPHRLRAGRGGCATTSRGGVALALLLPFGRSGRPSQPEPRPGEAL